MTRPSYIRSGDCLDHKAIYDECYAALSPEAQAELDEWIEHVLKVVKRKEIQHRLDNPGSTFKVAFGEVAAKELTVALILKGLL